MTTNTSPENRLCGLYIAALSAVAAAVIVGQIVVQSSLSSSLTDAVRVNLAGRQRMLSVDLVRRVNELATHDSTKIQEQEQFQQIASIATQLEDTHRGLRFGDETLRLEPSSSEAERYLLEKLEEPLNQMSAVAKKMAHAGSIDGAESNLEQFVRAQETFLSLMDRTVFRMSREASERIERSKTIETTLMMVTLGLLIVEALFVFRPATNQVRRSFTLLRQRERHLRESERRHRDLVRYSAGPILCLEPSSGRIADINPAGADGLKKTPEKLIGKRLTNFLTAESAERFEDQLNALEKLQYGQCQLIIRNPDGDRATRWLARFTIYHHDDDTPNVLLTAHDVTDQTIREQQLLEANRRDGLTGLLNRREFDLRVDDLADTHEARGTPFALALIDIDHFKRINDNYGHQTGDDLLRKLSQLIQNACRSADIVARYGGEEIAVLLPSLSCEEASMIAERIRLSLEQTDLHVGTDQGKQRTIRATASIGIAGVPQHASNPTNLIKRADDALYQAKQNGRNCVVFASLPKSILATAPVTLTSPVTTMSC